MITRTTGDVLSEMKMVRAAFSGTILVLEGASDSLFWRSRISRDTCQITVSGGKVTAARVAEALDKENFRGFLVVVDDDFDYFLGKAYESDNLVATETNDLETLLASSPALEKVLNEFLGHDAAHGKPEVISKIAKEAMEAGSVFGRLRYINRSNALNVSFDLLSPWKYVDHSTLKVKEKELLAEFAKLGNVDSAAAKGWLDGSPTAPVWNIVQGHDFTCLLAIALRGKTQHACSEKAICASLRLAYESAWFKASAIVRDIVSWEKRQGFTVLSS